MKEKGENRELRKVGRRKSGMVGRRWNHRMGKRKVKCGSIKERN